ncbi:hypothetical protein PROFUN_15985 [Planoprotostelium fungivorum]|uniref:Uncharacterized protein n=1 Tax=Planoprotostelium fungivorum TaxID=1890364 RepID=A0A2P6MTV1_9EUKA|nr:hypothetical protein PROFUN_15985 [Planoprotostelium fungivorum]
MRISWRKQRRRGFIALYEETFIFNRTHKHKHTPKLGMSEEVGGTDYSVSPYYLGKRPNTSTRFPPRLHKASTERMNAYKSS